MQGLQRMEAALDAVEGLTLLHLRPSYFLENTLGQAGAVVHTGAMASPSAPTSRFPWSPPGTSPPTR